MGSLAPSGNRGGSCSRLSTTMAENTNAAANAPKMSTPIGVRSVRARLVPVAARCRPLIQLSRIPRFLVSFPRCRAVVVCLANGNQRAEPAPRAGFGPFDCWVGRARSHATPPRVFTQALPLLQDRLHRTGGWPRSIVLPSCFQEIAGQTLPYP